jgi:bifunctional non-homologous end joining protein LigD
MSHREEFVVVGWTDPEGSRPYLGALLLAYYDPEGRLVYAGRAGTAAIATAFLWPTRTTSRLPRVTPM